MNPFIVDSCKEDLKLLFFLCDSTTNALGYLPTQMRAEIVLFVLLLFFLITERFSSLSDIIY